MKKMSLLLISFFAGMFFIQTIQAQETLYKRLGGYDALAVVTDDFVGRLITHKDMIKFFTGASDDTKKRIRMHIIEFLCEKSGGPCNYTGRDMKLSHKGLGITEAEWNTAAGLLVGSLNKFKVAKKEQDELLSFVTTLKKDIVEKMQ